ncbi:MAG: hypothetical protein K8H84_07875 [Sulfuricella denitrificans]|nr:hypothetical protein [Sulfuricella denitrificans]
MDDLNQLQNEAAAIDAEFIPAGEESRADQATPVMDYHKEAKGLIDFALSLFVPIFPSLDAIYTEQARMNLANASGPLMEKYDFSLGSLFERWGPEINFAMVAFPLSAQTYKAVKADIEAAKPKHEQSQQQGSAMGHPSMAQTEEQTL